MGDLAGEPWHTFVRKIKLHALMYVNKYKQTQANIHIQINTHDLTIIRVTELM